MCLLSVRIFEHAKTKMKLVNQVFTSFSLLDDVTMTSLYPFRGAMHPLVCSCTVVTGADDGAVPCMKAEVECRSITKESAKRVRHICWFVGAYL